MTRLMIAIYSEKKAAKAAKEALPSSARKKAKLSGPYDRVMIDDETKTPTTGHYQARGPNLWILQSEAG